jgi:hypothetical protein
MKPKITNDTQAKTLLSKPRKTTVEWVALTEYLCKTNGWARLAPRATYLRIETRDGYQEIAWQANALRMIRSAYPKGYLLVTRHAGLAGQSLVGKQVGRALINRKQS